MNKGTHDYVKSIQSYLQQCHFDMGVASSKPLMIDEAHLAKLLTRIVVSTATVVTTALSLKQYTREIYASYRKNKHGSLS